MVDVSRFAAFFGSVPLNVIRFFFCMGTHTDWSY
jgi:hypothetical protein